MVELAQEAWACMYAANTPAPAMGSRPTLGGQRELLKAISGVRDSLLQLLLAASSLCWTSPADRLRHRDAAVCLHLGSGSPSLPHVGSHMQGTCRVTPVSKERILQRICSG